MKNLELKTVETTENKAINKYVRQRGLHLAKEINDSMAIVVHPKPWWMPTFIYNAVVRKTVELVSTK